MIADAPLAWTAEAPDVPGPYVVREPLGEGWHVCLATVCVSKNIIYMRSALTNYVWKPVDVGYREWAKHTKDLLC